MSSKKTTEQHSKSTTNNKALFQPINYKMMIVGGVLFLLGIVLMMGGGSDNPDVFNDSEIYSFTRITLAPILIVLGLLMEMIAIIYRKK